MTPTLLLLVCLGGGLGAALRLVLDGLIRDRSRTSFPVATWLINVSGSLLLGVLTGLTIGQLLPDPAMSLLLRVAGTGFLGGYTTFSTASVDTVRLAEERRYLAAVANGLGMLVLAVAAAEVGLLVGRAL